MSAISATIGTNNAISKCMSAIREEIAKATKAARTVIRTDTATSHGSYVLRSGSTVLIISNTSSICTLPPAPTLDQKADNQT